MLRSTRKNDIGIGHSRPLRQRAVAAAELTWERAERSLLARSRETERGLRRPRACGPDSWGCL